MIGTVQLQLRASCTTCRSLTFDKVKTILRFCSTARNQRLLHTTSTVSPSYWQQVYMERKKLVDELPLDLEDKGNVCGVFANTEVRLFDISVYGFDYDYTLASYKPELHNVLYDLGKQALIKHYKYPAGIAEQSFNSEFAIRGLHYDVRKGLLMKIDSYHKIQPSTVYRGTTQLSDTEVEALYDGLHVPLEDLNFYGTGWMHQLVDMFAPPELNLITNVTDYFIKHNIPYDPEYVFYDIRNAVQGVHTSGLLHQTIMDDLDRFLSRNSEITQVLERLTDAGKKLFIITNSGFQFIDAGMKHMVGPQWRDLFDVIVVRARKPKFFTEQSRPFRKYESECEQSWGRVKSFDKGQVYIQGNFHDFRHMTGWFGSKVIYFGDHVYSDLADPSLKHGWRTGAIIPELEFEIERIMEPEFRRSVRWLIVLQLLLEEMQDVQPGPEDGRDQGGLELIPDLLEEREKLRTHLKTLCNPRFGSMFRTHHNPSYFSRRLARFADMYMSNMTNLLQYSVNHTFYPRRSPLPHEPLPFSDPLQTKTFP